VVVAAVVLLVSMRLPNSDHTVPGRRRPFRSTHQPAAPTRWPGQNATKKGETCGGDCRTNDEVKGVSDADSEKDGTDNKTDGADKGVSDADSEKDGTDNKTDGADNRTDGADNKTDGADNETDGADNETGDW
jgi:hypothetical protein